MNVFWSQPGIWDVSEEIEQGTWELLDVEIVVGNVLVARKGKVREEAVEYCDTGWQQLFGACQAVLVPKLKDEREGSICGKPKEDRRKS